MKLKRAEYLQVVGLLALAERHLKMLNDIEESICKVVGVPYRDGAGDHVGDAIYSEYSADEMLEKINYALKREAKAKK